MKENMLVLEMLLKNKMITRQNIAERIDEAKRSKNSILDVLVRDRIITEAEIVLIFHNEWGFERYDPLKMP